MTAVLTLTCETKYIRQFVHNSSNVSFKGHDSYGEIHRAKCLKSFQTLLLALKHALKLPCHWSITWSMKVAGCWPCFNQSLLQFIDDIPHWFLINMFLHVGFSQCLHARSGALVWFLCSPGWKWMVHILVMSCCWNSCCQTSVKLLGTFTFQCSTELLRHKTLDFTLDVWPHNRPDLNPVDYSIWSVI